MNIDITHYPLPVPPLFLKREMKLGRADYKKICIGNQKGEGRRNAKVIVSCDFFTFIFSLLTMMVTNTVFRKSNLEDLFLKKSGPWYF